mgnify:CR=1 FL=1
MNSKWHVYLLRCADDSLYCGITTSLQRRVYEHNYSKKSSKYTRSRRPVELVWSTTVDNRSQASKLEARIKKMSKKIKEQLVSSYNSSNSILDNNV